MDNVLDLLNIFVDSLSLVTISDMFKYLFIVFFIVLGLLILLGFLYVLFYLFLFKVIYNYFFNRNKKDS